MRQPSAASPPSGRVPPAPALSFLDTLEHRVARTLLRLPHALQVRLSGREPIVRDGQTLHPEMQLLLAFRERRRAPAFCELPPEKGRRWLRREARVHRGEEVPVGRVQELTVDGAEGPLRARHYVPPTDAPRPLLVFLHGGGFVLGDLETHDTACRMLCRHADVHVLSVDYRLAPEHPFPAAVHDAAAAFRWAVAHAAELGAEPSRVAVGGDSAGGNLAAVVSQLLAREGAVAPAAQLLIYPAIDRRGAWPSLAHFAEGFFLTCSDISWFETHYTGGREAGVLAAPLRAPELSGLPPAIVVTAGFDPLRDEGEAYAHALSRAGTRAVLRRFSGFVHGFFNMSGLSPACRHAVLEVAQLLRRELEGGRP